MKTIIANWKANPITLEEAMGLFDFYLAEISKYQNIQLVVCPPFIYLEELFKQLENNNHKNLISLGTQDVFWEKAGPYTGEVSPDMLKEFNITHVLIGHSDRRYKMGETDGVINKKIKAVLDTDIMPVLLVGEQNRGDDRKAVLEEQLSADLAGLNSGQVSKILFAYEPVWAISTTPGAEADTPENTLEAIRLIKNVLSSKFQATSCQFLYGGSVNFQNVANFLKYPEISGAVIGGASLRKEEFAEILRTAESIK